MVFPKVFGHCVLLASLNMSNDLNRVKPCSTVLNRVKPCFIAYSERKDSPSHHSQGYHRVLHVWRETRQGTVIRIVTLSPET